MNIVVVGAGVVGISAVLRLNQILPESRVTLVEAEPALGTRGSRRAAGGVRRQGRTVESIPLAIEAFETWRRISADHLAPDVMRQEGNLLVASSRASVDSLVQKYSRQQGFGLDSRLVSRAEIQSRFPGIRDTVELGMFSPGDAQIHPELATDALAAIVSANDRNEILLGTRVAGIEEGAGERHRVRLESGDSLEADYVIVTAGFHSAPVLASLGYWLPINPARVVSVRTEPVERLSGSFLQDWDTQLFLRQNMWGGLQFGYLGQDFLEPFLEEVPEQDVGRALEAFRDTFPGFPELRIERVWNGLIDESLDRQPIIGPIPGRRGILVAAGWSGHGFLLGPHVGFKLAEYVESGSLPEYIAPFSPGRFRASATTSNVDS